MDIKYLMEKADDLFYSTIEEICRRLVEKHDIVPILADTVITVEKEEEGTLRQVMDEVYMERFGVTYEQACYFKNEKDEKPS